MAANVIDVRVRVSHMSGASTVDLKHWTLTDEIPGSMPILDRWLEQIAPDRPLTGVTALMIQHQLGNHVPQAKALLELGIAARDLYWIDIPYTSTPAVRAALLEIGIPSANILISDFRVLDKYTPVQRARVQRFLLDLYDDAPDRLLVLDDGSYMLEALAGLRPRPRPDVAIVEQTTRGLIKLEENAALEQRSKEIPIVNVARSAPKSTLEPPFIGIAVTESLGRRLGVLIGRTTSKVTARAATAEQHDRLWPLVAETHAGYARYQERTTRPIPIVLLAPRPQFSS